MQKFSDVAVDTAGKESRGVIEASNQADAIAKVRWQGPFPIAVDPVSNAAAITGVHAGPQRRRNTAEEKNDRTAHQT